MVVESRAEQTWDVVVVVVQATERRTWETRGEHLVLVLIYLQDAPDQMIGKPASKAKQFPTLKQCRTPCHSARPADK